MSARVDHDVVVIGAGPTGLFAAAELQRRGLDVALLEARPEVVAGSRAIGVHAPTLAALEASGATERLLAHAVRIPRGLAMSQGRVLGDIRFDRLPLRFPFVAAVPQPATEAAVAHGGPEPRRGARVTALADRGDRVDVVLGTGGEVLRARMVVVAGGRSGRALVPAAGVRERGYRDRYVMADVPGPTGEPGDLAVVVLDPAGVLESFPLPGGGRRLVAWDGVDPGMTAAAAATDAPGGASELERLRVAVAERGGGVALAAMIEGATTFGIRRALARRMRVGRVVAIGDTAHEVSPMGGQGMNLGLLDAATLAPLVAEWLRGDEPPLALARWERDRLVSARTAGWMAGLNTALGRRRSPVAHRATVSGFRAAMATPARDLLARAYAMGFDRAASRDDQRPSPVVTTS